MQNIIQRNNKAVAGIITVVILILLSMAAVSILYSSVKKIEKPLLSPTSCIDLQLDLPISITKACFSNNTLKITLSKLDEKLKIDSLEFVIQKQKETSYWSCGTCNSCKILNSGTKTYYFTLPEQPDKLSLKIRDCIFGEKPVSEC